jgi:hypothetical protein
MILYDLKLGKELDSCLFSTYFDYLGTPIPLLDK